MEIVVDAKKVEIGDIVNFAGIPYEVNGIQRLTHGVIRIDSIVPSEKTRFVIFTMPDHTSLRVTRERG